VALKVSKHRANSEIKGNFSQSNFFRQWLCCRLQRRTILFPAWPVVWLPLSMPLYLFKLGPALAWAMAYMASFGSFFISSGLVS
jgi:hypothetical protein